MSRTTFIKKIEEEINKLNMRIDLKIIRGKSYLKEAKRHKFLLSQIATFRKTEVKILRPASTVMSGRPVMKMNWLGKTASFVRTFIF